jgi:hypothetical protein
MPTTHLKGSYPYPIHHFFRSSQGPFHWRLGSVEVAERHSKKDPNHNLVDYDSAFMDVSHGFFIQFLVVFIQFLKASWLMVYIP